MKITVAVLPLLLASAVSAQGLPDYRAPEEVVRALAGELSASMLADFKKLSPCPAQGVQLYIELGRVICRPNHPRRWMDKVEPRWAFVPREGGAFARFDAGRDSFLVHKDRRGGATTLEELMERGALVTDRDAARANDLVRAQAGAQEAARVFGGSAPGFPFPR